MQGASSETGTEYRASWLLRAADEFSLFAAAILCGSRKSQDRSWGCGRKAMGEEISGFFYK